MSSIGSFFVRRTISLQEWLRAFMRYIEDLPANADCSKTLQTVPVWKRDRLRSTRIRRKIEEPPSANHGQLVG